MAAEIIKIDIKNYRMDLLYYPAKVLSEGGMVVFPTETVYGLGTNANLDSSVRRLYEVKNSPEHRPFTIHLSSVEEVYCHVSIVPRLALRLMKAFWPGPLTLVLPVVGEHGKNSWVGLRVPDHIIARDLIKLSKVTVVASSANFADQSAPIDAQTVIESLGNKVNVIIDAGPCKIGASSTVVKVTEDNKFEIIRQGSITRDNIQRVTYNMIIFICSGNTCRSPMAMGLFRKMLADRLKIPIAGLEENGYKIISAGTSAIYGSPASGTSIEIMKGKNVDINGHRSQPVTLSMLEEADEIYVMTNGHLATLKEWMPLISKRIKLLDPAGNDIEDPIMTGREGYQKCASKIQKALEKIIC